MTNRIEYQTIDGEIIHELDGVKTIMVEPDIIEHTHANQKSVSFRPYGTAKVTAIISDKCIRCGKRLKDPISKLLGYGPDCYRKYKNEKRRKLF